jgi:peroxiredoxin
MQASSYKLPLGAQAPLFRALPGVDGQSYDLGTFADQQALVIVWHCNHCPYAQAYEQRFIDAAKDYQPRGVGFLAINSNWAPDYPEDSFDKMQERARAHAYPFPYVYDESQEVAEAYGAVCTPHVFVFDRDRRLAYQGRFDGSKDDPAKGRAQELRDALDDLLGGRPVRNPQTTAFGCSVKWGPSHFQRVAAGTV